MTERNNLDRMPPQQEAPPPQQTMTSNPDLHFSVPTEFVQLPSKGKYYPPNHLLHNKESVEIKYMTAREEDILASASLIKKGVVFDRLLQSVMIDRINPDDLLIGDKNAILVASRITGYGTGYDTDVTCPSCSDRGKFSFDLSEARIEIPNDERLSHNKLMDLPDAEETGNGTHLITLPELKNCKVEIRPLNGHDEKRLASVASAKVRNHIAESAVTDTLKTYIVSVNGNNAPDYISQFVDALPASQARKIRIMYRQYMPKASVEGLYSCANCGHRQELEVPINSNFFWPDE
jgi:hypothetical protein